MGFLNAATVPRANLILSRTGQPFWQDESFDRLVRNEDEFRGIERYIGNHRVCAGLARSPEEYRWSSASRPERPSQAGSLAHK